MVLISKARQWRLHCSDGVFRDPKHEGLMHRDHWYDENGAETELGQIDLNTPTQFASAAINGSAYVFWPVECVARARPQDISIVPFIARLAKVLPDEQRAALQSNRGARRLLHN
jgi:hypothetical protein